MTEILEPASGEVMGPSPRIADALRAGAAGGAQTAQELWSLVGRGASTTAYQGAYYLAYGVTFGAMLVGHFIPRDSSFSRGLREGTDNAVSAFHSWEEPVFAPEQPVPGAQAQVGAIEEPAAETPVEEAVRAT
jgi:hypothetical protein